MKIGTKVRAARTIPRIGKPNGPRILRQGRERPRFIVGASKLICLLQSQIVSDSPCVASGHFSRVTGARISRSSRLKRSTASATQFRHEKWSLKTQHASFARQEVCFRSV